MLLGIGLIFTSFSLVSGFIIPEELPSLLSLLYSNIPPVKKGTDSRVGFGFKLGPHADFQVMLELGPQTNTAGIGPNAEPQGKRETLTMENTDTLVEMVNTGKMPLPQYQSENDVENEVEQPTSEKPTSIAGKWIDSWRNAFTRNSLFGKIKFKPVPGIDSRRDNFQPFQPFQRPKRLNFVDQLRKLYRPVSK